MSSSVIPFSSCLQSFPASSNELALHIRWLKYWSLSFSTSPSIEYSGLISFRVDWSDLLAVQRTLKSVLQHHSLKASIIRGNQFSSVQLLSRVRLFVTPWIAARQASLSITNTQSLLKLMSIESVMLTSHLILCCPLLLLPPIPPSIRVFSNESTLHMRWPNYWSFSLSISPSNEYPRQFPFRMDWLDLLAVQGESKGLSRVFSNTTVQKHQFFGAQLSLQSNSHIHTGLLAKP